MKARVLFQELCAKGRQWDEPLSGDEEKEFLKWLLEIKELKYLTLPRTISETSDDPADFELHVFCDASAMGYCAAAYLVYEGVEGKKSRLLTAKSRLAPLKKLTIPRLELLSARTGAKLANTILKALGVKINNVYMWLDSLTALYWIENKGAWKPYVGNRTKEIHELVPGAVWSHCPTKLNPSDLGTRGASAAKLQHCTLWWEGPEFLKEDQDSWPEQPSELKPAEEAIVEEKSPSLLVKTEGSIGLQNVVELERFSSLQKLLRCTARVFRFVENCRKQKDQRLVDANLTSEELRSVKIRWIQSIQHEMTGWKEFEQRSQDLGVFQHEDGFLRCGGRLRNSDLNFEQKHPILLPTKHRFTDLVVLDCHVKVGHEKIGRTLAEVRAEFWVPRGRQVVKSIVKGCRLCKIYSAKSMASPQMAPLPDTRARRTRPFQHTGVDFAGPLYVKSGKETVKAYITLFTCATTRAVHLELAEDMTASVFRMTLEKFVAAWGMPNLMISDNASTFKTTALQLKKLFDHPEIQEYLQSNISLGDLTWPSQPGGEDGSRRWLV